MMGLTLIKKGRIPIIQQLKVLLLSEKTQSLKRNPNQRLPSWTGLMFSSNTFSDLSENTTAKAFNDVTQYRKRKRRVTQKLTLLGAMKEFKQETFPTVELPDLEIYLLSLITHRVSPRIPKRKKWAKIKDLMKTTLYQFNRKRLQTFLSHTQFAFLLLKFLETPDILSTLSKRSQLIKDEKCRETLVHHINLLKEECSNKLSNKSNNFLA
mmetsp:Transcript_6103/g.5714  ORF Transcript_6103/g.5714 Transcript_6103/m.5714 type:complete len:210 (-) Transcript_6103:181-810(-)